MLRRIAGLLGTAVVLAACSHEAVTVRIDPAQATVVRGGQLTFRAVVTGSGKTGVTWSVREGASGGKIDASGVYTAPASGGIFHVLAIPDAAPLEEAEATVTVTSEAVLFTSVSPASPANENSPTVKGMAEPRASVKLYGSADCSGEPLGTGTAGEDGAFAIRASVADDTTTAFHATAGASACSTASISYVEDSAAPAAPTFTGVSPGATGSDDSPRFSGTAENGSTVRLYSGPSCTELLAQGSAADFSAGGLAVTVATGATVNVRATATDAAGNASPCSTSTLSYTQQDATPPPTWRGPTARLEFVSGSNEAFLVIDGQRHRPVFISVNPQAIQDPSGWAPLIAEIDLAAQHGMPVVDLMLANHTVGFLQELANHLGNRQVYLWLRFDLWIPELAQLGVPSLKTLDGTEQAGYRKSFAVSRDGHWSEIPFYSTLDQPWLDAEKAFVETLLNDVSASGIGDRVIGVRPTYMAGGEWFQPPLAFHDGVLDDTPPNKWPWSNPEAFSIGDYSPRERDTFRNWLQFSGLDATIAIPEPAERINPRLGRTFVVGTDGSGTPSALYHRFAAERVAWLQIELAKKMKDVTGGKALVMVNNGYTFSLAFYNGSFHTALGKVLDSPYIDGISAPYNYNVQGSRSNGFALIAHGPMDSPALHGKLWIHEDDSRPYWSNDGFGATATPAEDEALLLRNAVTSLLHGNALYYFDLPDKGWFGGVPAHAAETEALYAKVQAVASKLDGRLARSGPIQPQIAVFVDEASSHLYPEFGFDGASSYVTSNQLMLGMVEKISRLGAPVRYYLLDDLANPNLDVSAFKLVLFLNTPRLTQAQRAQLRTRLMNGGRVLYFQHVSGLFDETLRPQWTLASEYSPGVSSLAQIEASTSTAVTTSDHGTWVVAYSPKGADEAALANLLTQAGVHRYATNAVVDGAGSVLMVHSRGGPVNLQLPRPSVVADLATGAQACANCSSLVVNMASPETRVFQLTSRRLFRYEWTPGSVGGFITEDERTYCGLPDGNALANCGFTGADYMNAPITPYGQLSLTDTGECACGHP